MPTLPPKPPRRCGYGIVAYTDEPGLFRFVAHGLSEPQRQALEAEARRLGIPASSTAGWLTRSESH